MNERIEQLEFIVSHLQSELDSQSQTISTLRAKVKELEDRFRHWQEHERAGMRETPRTDEELRAERPPHY